MLNIAQYFPITDPTLIFFVVMIIILFAPIIMGKLRIPHIIGMVLAGVLIGNTGSTSWSATLPWSCLARLVCTTSCFWLPSRWTWRV